MTNYNLEVEELEPRGTPYGPDTMRLARKAQRRAYWMGMRELSIGFGLFLLVVVAFVAAILMIGNWNPQP